MGKINIEPGLVPRTLDRYCLDRFAFSQNKEIHVLYKECDNYVKPKPINKLDGKYIPPNLRSIAAVERPRQALKNFEKFHGMSEGTATLDQVQKSSAGLRGWASASNNERYINNLIKFII